MAPFDVISLEFTRVTKTVAVPSNKLFAVAYAELAYEPAEFAALNAG
jgi:hypothetical protein